VLSKGVIVLEERRHSATGAKTRHEFSLTFDASTAQLLSPTAHIIVWCVTQTGEIVSDSLEVSVDAAFANEVSTAALQLNYSHSHFCAFYCCQCFDAVGRALGRAPGL